MKELAVGTSAHLVDHSWLQINHHASRHVLSSACFREEGVKGVVPTSDGLVTGHLPIRLDTMLEAEKLPACISDLHARLANVDADSLTHCFERKEGRSGRV